ncbi:MAG: SPOR domain-containing protein [Crocinitomicaceae bacterium]|nr:SPOR domain-containing protein [Crocinitomicaceae bacterium]
MSFYPLSQENFIIKRKEVSGKISPKSIVTDGSGHFAAQNMMYRHSVTFYNEEGELLHRMQDEVNLHEYGFNEYNDEVVKGAPVEAVYTKDGRYIYVSNYAMEGDEFTAPGCDGCIGKEYDPSFIYKINTESYAIEQVIKVGSVPKFLALSNDEKLLISSNWTSSDISIVNTETGKEIKAVKVGAHPRGIAIDSQSEFAYVTIMGSSMVAKVNLSTYQVDYIKSIGSSPRHLSLSKSDSTLYISVNSSNTVVKYNLFTEEKVVCRTNAGPRSMILSPDEKFIYVVNYFANTFSKIQTDSMKVVEVQKTNEHPIGIAANWDKGDIWVACYVGVIEIHKDFELMKKETSIFDEIAEFLALNNMKMEEPVPVKEPEEMQKEIPVTEEVIDTVMEEESITTELIADTVDLVLAPILTSIAENKKGGLAKSYVSKRTNEPCNYHVIVGTFSIYDNAVNRGDEIQSKGYNVNLISGKSGVTYVSAECFSSRDAAKANISEIAEGTGIKGWVLKY